MDQSKSGRSDRKPGDRIEAPEGRLQTIDPQDLKPREVYQLLIEAIVPRPIAFVSSCDSAGRVNLAPFSFFNGVSSRPACLAISIARKRDGEKKDTLRNIEETGQFVVNSANLWLLDPLVHCGAAFPYGVNEFQAAGLSEAPSQKVKPPRVKESALAFECELHQKLEIGDGQPGSSTLVVGKILLIHVPEAGYRDGKLDLDALKPIARLGGQSYCSIGQQYQRVIPEVD